MADHDPLGGRGRARGVLQQREVVAVWRTRQPGRGCGGRRGDVNGEPDKTGGGDALREVTAFAVDQRPGGEREARRAVGDDRGAGVAPRLPPRHHQRDGDNAGEDAAEQTGDKVDPGRTQQERALARRRLCGDPRGERFCPLCQFGKGDRRRLAAAIRQHDIGAVVGLRGGAVPQQIGERVSWCGHSRYDARARRSSDSQRQVPVRARSRAIPPVRR